MHCSMRSRRCFVITLGERDSEGTERATIVPTWTPFPSTRGDGWTLIACWSLIHFGVPFCEVLQDIICRTSHRSPILGEGNPSEKRRRLGALLEANVLAQNRHGATRSQFLGVKLCHPRPGQSTSNEMRANTTVDMETQIREMREIVHLQWLRDYANVLDETQWIRPWAVRATSGQSPATSEHEIEFERSKVAYFPTPMLVETLGGGFHATPLSSLGRIVEDGLWPGASLQRGGGGKIHIFFGIHAPWDERNQSTRHRLHGHLRDQPMAVIYIPGYALLQFGAMIMQNATYLVQRPIPFEMVSAVWIAVPNTQGRGFRQRVKVYSKTLEDEIVEDYDGFFQDINTNMSPRTPAFTRRSEISWCGRSSTPAPQTLPQCAQRP